MINHLNFLVADLLASILYFAKKQIKLVNMEFTILFFEQVIITLLILLLNILFTHALAEKLEPKEIDMLEVCISLFS